MRSGEQEPGKYQGAWSIRRLTPRVARWIRIFTGDDDQSHFSVSEIEWNDTQALNAISESEQAKTISCEETAEGASLDWHNVLHRQYVITLSGRPELETRTGARQVLERVGQSSAFYPADGRGLCPTKTSTRSPPVDGSSTTSASNPTSSSNRSQVARGKTPTT